MVFGDRLLADACDRGTRLIITTGGLGPTPDDLTVEILSYFGLEPAEGMMGHRVLE